MFSPDVLNPTVDRIDELGGGGRLLEFAIGTGRVGIPLAERGLSVSGIELSGAMIARLREKMDAQRLPVVQGDMATARVEGEFAVVFVVYNSISNLLTQAEQVRCVRNAARHLGPGGCFVVELFVPDLRALPAAKTASVFVAEPGHLGVDTWDVVLQRLVSHHVPFQPDSGSRDASLFRSAHRYIWPSELDLMAELACLRLESRHADWNGSPFTSESTSHVSVYRRDP